MPPPSSLLLQVFWLTWWGSCVGRSGGRGLRDFHRRRGLDADGCYHWEGGDFFALKLGFNEWKWSNFDENIWSNWVLFNAPVGEVHSKWWAAVDVYIYICIIYFFSWQGGRDSWGPITGGRYFFLPKDVLRKLVLEVFLWGSQICWILLVWGRDRYCYPPTNSSWSLKITPLMEREYHLTIKLSIFHGRTVS